MDVIKKQSTSNFPKKKNFLPPDTHRDVWVSGGKKCSFFGKFDVLCSLVTPVLRFTLLPYYRRFNPFDASVPVYFNAVQYSGIPKNIETNVNSGTNWNNLKIFTYIGDLVTNSGLAANAAFYCLLCFLVNSLLLKLLIKMFFFHLHSSITTKRYCVFVQAGLTAVFVVQLKLSIV